MATIAGALERKVWVRAFSRTLYPNLYILLIGGPGVGKTDALREVLSFWSTLPKLHVAPSSVSRASLADSLAEAKRTVYPNSDDGDLSKTVLNFNALNVAATEFGTFLSQYETEFLSTLNDLYDCVRYKESKRHMKGKVLEIEDPWLNLVAGTTPAWLGGTLPETAWAEGFSSRLLMIHAGERILVQNIWDEVNRNEELESALNADLGCIYNLVGQMYWEEDVKFALQEWYHSQLAPVPDHPKLEHYLPRRHVHFMKLCMVMCAARTDSMIINMTDYRRAQDFLLEAEFHMPDVFKSMKSIHSDSNAIEECYRFVRNAYLKEDKPVAEFRVIHFLLQKVPSYAAPKVVEQMVAAGIIEIAGTEKGRNVYRPGPQFRSS